jgi:hypothetical protein
MPEMTGVTDLAVGTAAEHLVCADLLLLGYRAFLADQNCPYDVAVEQGGRLIRIQVKSTRQPRKLSQRPTSTPRYMWHVKRAGKGARRMYLEGDFDVLALVAIDCRAIAYWLPTDSPGGCIYLREPGILSGHANARLSPVDGYPFADVLERLL